MRPRGRFLALTVAISFALAAVAPAAPAAADYVYYSAAGSVCRGGNTAGPTIGEIMRQRGEYAHLPAAAQVFADHVYDGTYCTQRIRLAGVAPLPGQTLPTPSVVGLPPVPEIGVDPSSSTSTSPWGSCSPPSGGCITATAIFGNTITSTSFNYTAEIIMELDSYDGATGSWSAIDTNFHNNHGNSWGMGISNGTWVESDHNRYYTDAWGTGSYQYWNADPGVSSQNYFSDQVHMGYRSNLTINYAGGGQSVATYCWYGDFQSYNAGVIGGGWCANP